MLKLGSKIWKKLVVTDYEIINNISQFLYDTNYWSGQKNYVKVSRIVLIVSFSLASTTIITITNNFPSRSDECTSVVSVYFSICYLHVLNWHLINTLDVPKKWAAFLSRARARGQPRSGSLRIVYELYFRTWSNIIVIVNKTYGTLFENK